MKIYFIILFVFTVNQIIGQPAIQWQKCYGGSGDDRANSIEQTTDGGYIIAGNSQSHDGDVTGNNSNGSLCWIVKIDAIGNIQWQKFLDELYEYSIKQTNDGGYIVAGVGGCIDSICPSYYGAGEYFVVKLDAASNIQWEKWYGGLQSEIATSIEQTIDGGYIVAGHTASYDGDVSGNNYPGFWVIKLDTAGNMQWQKSYGGTYVSWAFSIKQTSDGGYIVAGYTESSDGDVVGKHGGLYSDYWVVKIDSVGIIQWQKCLGGTNLDFAYSITPTNDKGYIVAGYTKSIDGDIIGIHNPSNLDPMDMWVVKLNSYGNIQWQKCLGGNNIDLANSIIQTTDGGYVVAGYTFSIDGDVTGIHSTSYADFWIVKLNNNGNIQWQKCLGGNNYEEAKSIKQTNDGGYIVAGEVFSNNGDVTGNHGSSDYWVVKLANVTEANQISYNNTEINIYPNPCNKEINISLNNNKYETFTLSIIDITGNTVAQLITNSNNYLFNTEKLSKGLYLVKAESTSGVSIVKFNKE